MRILVPVKRVIDFNVQVRVKPDRTGVEFANTKMSMNPFDEIAVEAAVRLREAGLAAEIVAVSIGVRKCEDVLRTALAMGCDRAILIETGADGHTDIEPLAVAKLLRAVVEAEDAGLVICGKQAIDNDINATGQMLAALLGWGQATFASDVGVADGAVSVACEVDGGMQTVRVPLPAVVTADLRLNEPRYASLPNVMRARQKPLEIRPVADFAVDIAPRLDVTLVEPPPARLGGVMVGSVDELIDRLRREARVL
jgi:electron transfer flavoprotein beta subunit